MTDPPVLVAANDATDEAADGLALARLLAACTDSELLVTRVLENEVGAVVDDPATQRAVPARVGETRRAMLAALPDASFSAPGVPALGPLVRKQLHEVARHNDASMLVVGSSGFSRTGRVVLGGTAEAVINHAPCAVAVAPPRFRLDPRIAPNCVGCAFDGTIASIDALLAAAGLALAIAAPLRVISVAGPAEASRLCDDADALVREISGPFVELECVALEGDPATALIDHADDHVGLLVTGSRGLGPIRRTLLGSVSAKVLRYVSCPVVVVPRRG